jgi:hypothetical protein
MTAEINDPYHTDPRRMTEQILCEVLNNYAKGAVFHPSNADTQQELPFGSVYVEESLPTIGDRSPRAYLMSIKVVYVSHINEVGSQLHSENVSRIQDGLNTVANKQYTESYLRQYDLHSGKCKVMARTGHLYFEDLDVTRVAKGDYCELTINKDLKEVARVDHISKTPSKKYLATDKTYSRAKNNVPCRIYRDILKIDGIHVESIGSSQEDFSYGDVFSIRAGVITCL